MLLTLDIREERAREARENFARAGLADRVNVIVGDAKLKIAKVSGPFDLIFQDGDKNLYTPLLDRLIALLRPGGLLITDNVLWDGEVVPGFKPKPERDAQYTRAIAEYNERLATHPQLMTVIGHDGPHSSLFLEVRVRPGANPPHHARLRLPEPGREHMHVAQ